METQMEDPRCKIAAVRTEGPRRSSLLRGVTIEMEDPRCSSLLRGVVLELEIEDPRCRKLEIEVEDPRCKALLVRW
jgi:hypothetical protein